MRIAKRLGFCAVILGMLAASPAIADTPSAVMYEGALFIGNTAAEGSFALKFDLFTEEAGGAPVASFDAGEVPVSRGVFAVDVGALFAEAEGDLYLSVSVKGSADADYDQLPRVAVSSVPFALRARVADSVDWANVTNAPEPEPGPQGATGLKGAAGPEGPAGPAGPEGKTGAAGPVGAQGPQGLVGPEGDNGAVGPMGPQGAVGVQGLRGESVVPMSLGPNSAICPTGGVQLTAGSEVAYVCNGDVGLQGAMGPQGFDGPPGDSVAIVTLGLEDADCPTGGTQFSIGPHTAFVCNGADGLPGVVGAVGPVGADGAMGPVGPAGEQGPQGLLGPQGLMGPVGADGAMGPVGPAGAQGLQGPQGDEGPQGIQGIIGPQGPAGDIGPVGATGATGQAGAPGSLGPAGPAGPVGATGAPGATGAQGPQGMPGSGGALAIDANGVVLGRMVSFWGATVNVLTSTGYFVNIQLDGVIPTDQIWYTAYSGGTCGGTAYLNDGWGNSGGAQLYAKTVIHSGSFGQLMVPETVDSLGMSLSVPIFAAGIDNPACGSANYPAGGWKLVATTRAVIGLPAVILPPITLQ